MKNYYNTNEETETVEEVTVKTVNPVLDALEVLDRVQAAHRLTRTIRENL